MRSFPLPNVSYFYANAMFDIVYVYNWLLMWAGIATRFGLERSGDLIPMGRARFFTPVQIGRGAH